MNKDRRYKPTYDADGLLIVLTLHISFRDSLTVVALSQNIPGLGRQRIHACLKRLKIRGKVKHRYSPHLLLEDDEMQVGWSLTAEGGKLAAYLFDGAPHSTLGLFDRVQCSRLGSI